MITEIRDQKLVVISGLHLGNPFSKAKNPTVEFFHWAGREGYDIVINGDGFEIAQVSFSKIARDVPEVFHAIKSFTAKEPHVATRIRRRLAGTDLRKSALDLGV